MHRDFRKPLIMMMPKSLLRLKESTSPIAEFSSGGFRPVIDDDSIRSPERVRRILFCTGKVYFDLLEAQRLQEQDLVAIIRIEQLNPFPWEKVRKVISRYPSVQVCWVQEEPQNMGGWDFVEPKLRKSLSDSRMVEYIGSVLLLQLPQEFRRFISPNKKKL